MENILSDVKILRKPEFETVRYINDGGNDLVRLIDENKMIPAYYASSGVQSAMPKGRGDSMLVMTTHSPYILSTLNVLIAEAYAMDTKPKSDKLRNIVNKECLFPLSAYSAYYIQEDGKFCGYYRQGYYDD